MLVGGSALITLAYIAGLAAATRAFGGSASFAAIGAGISVPLPSQRRLGRQAGSAPGGRARHRTHRHRHRFGRGGAGRIGAWTVSGHHDSVLTDEVISGWCRGTLGATFGRVLFRRQHLSEVVAVQLADGRQVVVKARPFEDRLAGCVAVEAALAKAGFPCPGPIGEPMRIGGHLVTAETLIPGGDLLSPACGSGPFAILLAQLIHAAPGVKSVPSLSPAPPWTGWDHPGTRLWPDRDDRGQDLNQANGPHWVDDAAQQVRQRMRSYHAPARIGHGDWESQNIRWRGGQPLAVHDWDSVIAQPEEAIVGLAAAVWPAAGGPGEAASVAQTEELISAYQMAAGATWSGRQVQVAWTAGLWVRLFNAKKDAADGGGAQLDRLASEITERLSRARLRPG